MLEMLLLTKIVFASPCSGFKINSYKFPSITCNFSFLFAGDGTFALLWNNKKLTVKGNNIEPDADLQTGSKTGKKTEFWPANRCINLQHCFLSLPLRLQSHHQSTRFYCTKSQKDDANTCSINIQNKVKKYFLFHTSDYINKHK